MTINIIATIVLAYFIVRECGYALRTWAAPYDRIWVVVSVVLVLALLLPLWAVWS